MVDNPDPIERTGADPVTPEAVRNRANEIFGGVDLSASGTYPNSFGIINVDYFGEGLFRVAAEVHGIPVATMERIEPGE